MVKPLFTVFGARVRADSKECAESFREDRRHRLIYPSVSLEDESLISWEAASVKLGFCVYCGPARKEN